MTKKLHLGLAALLAGLFFAPVSNATTPQVEQQVEKLLAELSSQEKLQLLGGVDGFYTRDIPHIHLPRLKMSDGPVGTRNDGASTAYPSGSLLACTWDPSIAKSEGQALGRDARARGDHFLLGPGVNIYRVPQNGRNFEYFGEDPFLSAAMAPAYIQGVQSQGVAACVKHYACNNQETRREGIDTLVDERTLQEIYLPAFEAAVKQGHVQSVMASYNRINGDYATANKYLLTDVLRTQFGFDGLLMSDWGATHDTLGPANAGLDLEMPAGDYLNEKKLAPLISEGKVTQATIDEKVRRLLRVAVEMNWLDRPQKDESIPKDDPTSDAVALSVAREGIVLLKNNASLLPLNRNKVKRVVVLGSGADQYIAGGGSSITTPTHSVTLLAGIQALANGVQITSIPFTDWRDKKLSQLAKSSVYQAGKNGKPGESGKPGLVARFYNSIDLTGDVALTRNDAAISFDWKHKLPAAELKSPKFSASWTGEIKPAEAGDYTFVVRSDDGSRVRLDGKEIVNNWQDQAAHTESTTIHLAANQSHQLQVDYYNVGGDASVQFAYFLAPPMFTPEQKQQLAEADAAVVCVHTRETEGADRAYALPIEQEQLIQAAAAINPKTVVVLEAGGNVAMKNWIDSVAGLVHAGFPGQEGGKAIAEVLFGDTNPSGHLADTFENDWTDSPAYGHYPGEDGKIEKVQYAEGIYVGYRWYDKKKIEPRYPFGFGLSYTSFAIRNLKSVATGDVINVTVDVTNTGKIAGATVTQLYVKPPTGQAVDRPVQELKGFARVQLQPGETKSVVFPLTARSFSHWDITSHSWKALPGDYELVAGQSSRDAATSAMVTFR